jgi:hypothetical protein
MKIRKLARYRAAKKKCLAQLEIRCSINGGVFRRYSSCRYRVRRNEIRSYLKKTVEAAAEACGWRTSLGGGGWRRAMQW